MREKLNSNPMVQMAVIAVLLVGAGIFIFSSMGGGSEPETGAPSPSASVAPSPGLSEVAPPPEAGTVAALAMVNQATAGASRPLPRPVVSAWEADRTVVLLIVHDGGIDDALVKLASLRLVALSRVSTFVVPASQIARYAAITEGVGVDRVPALVVLRPKRIHQQVPTASVSYGFQSGESIVQAVIDAGYRGPTLEYHP